MEVYILELILLLIGLALNLYGYRLSTALLPVWAFLAGFWLGAELTAQTLNTDILGNVAGWAVGIGLGLVLALLSHFLHELKFGIIGAVTGYWIGSGLAAALGLGTGILSILAGIAAALVVAGLFYLLNVKKIVSMATTAIVGSYAILLAILLIIGRVSLASLETAGGSIRPILQESWIWPIIWLALALIGYIYQDRETRSYAFTHGDS